MRLLIALLALALPSTALAGDIYLRVAADGSVYFTDAPSRKHERAGDRGWNKVFEPRVPAKAVPVEAPKADDDAPTQYVVEAQPAGFRGLQLEVTGRINGRAEVPFLVDTGAAVSSIPRAMLKRVGVTVDQRTPTSQVRGFSGETRTVPIVHLATVSVGGATLRDVPMVVSDELEVGLLGMSFLRHFKVEVDAQSGEVVLSER